MSNDVYPLFLLQLPWIRSMRFRFRGICPWVSFLYTGENRFPPDSLALPSLAFSAHLLDISTTCSSPLRYFRANFKVKTGNCILRLPPPTTFPPFIAGTDFPEIYCSHSLNSNVTCNAFGSLWNLLTWSNFFRNWSGFFVYLFCFSWSNEVSMSPTL